MSTKLEEGSRDMQDEQMLAELNRQISEAEKQGNKSFFEDTLAENLIFRRASGQVVTKQKFLDDLATDVFDILIADIDNVKIYQNTAVVVVYITAKRKVDEQEGMYLNIRVFTKDSNQWKLSAWFNNKV